MAEVDAELIRTLAGLLDENRLTEIEYEAQGVRVRVGRAPANVVAAAPALMAGTPLMAAPLALAGGVEVLAGAVPSPMVGVVYLSAEPGQPAFVKPGDQVSEGQTLLLIEAMKTFNAIRSPRAGRVTRVLVTDGQPVEFAEPLLVLE